VVRHCEVQSRWEDGVAVLPQSFEALWSRSVVDSEDGLMRYIIRIRFAGRSWPMGAWWEVLENMGVRFHDREREAVKWAQQSP